MKISSLGIIGYGGMGQLIHSSAAKFLSPDRIRVHDTAINTTSSAAEAMQSDLVVFCVNDENLNSCLQSVKTHLKKNSVYITISAIMTHSLNCIKSLNGDFKFIITHPLFGPASYRNNGNNLNDFRIAISNHTLEAEHFEAICNFLTKLGLQTIKTYPQEHDESSARDHFIPYLISHVLKDLTVGQSPIRTHSATQLNAFLECTSYSKTQLKAMYLYNPYVKEMINSFNACLQNTLKELQK